MCQGAIAVAYGNSTSGGTWSSSNTAIISIGSATGLANGVAAGSATITYTHASGTVTLPVTVLPLPATYTLFFAGSGSICAGSPGSMVILSGSQTGVTYQLFNGGVAMGWPLAGTGSSLNFGAQTAAGTYTARATDDITGCMNFSGPATLTLLPNPGPIGGPSSVCIGSSATYTNGTSGGTWASSNPSVATVGSAGVVSGITTGSSVISYTLSSGCGVTTTVNVINLISPITGSGGLCVAGTTALSNPSPGGTWTSSNTARAVVGSSSGLVTGISTGTATITYTIGGSCGYVTKPVTVSTSPAAITGITSICAGSVATLSSTTSGGAWSSSNTTVATVGSASGIVAGLSGGLSTISYTVAGCSRTTIMAIDPTPVISGGSALCVSDTIMLITASAGPTGGTWTSSNPTVASVGSYTGVVTGNIPGTAIITSTSTSTGCASTRTVTVSSSCTGTPVGGTANASFSFHCSGKADTLYLTGATTTCGIIHQWQYSSDSIAWYNVPGGSFDRIIVHPQARTWYRCRLSCYSTALSAYSSVTRVDVYNSITSHYVTNTPSYFCNGPHFDIRTCGVGLNSKVKSYYGDGTSDSSMLTHYSDSSGAHGVFHQYSYPGTYTVKQVLYDGTIAQDSITTSVAYNHCRTLSVRFFYDINNNCLNDDAGYLNHSIATEVDSNGVHIDTIYANYSFHYRALGDTGTVYRFRVIAHDTGIHLTCPSTGIIYDTITSYTNTYPQKLIGFNCSATTAYDLGFSNTHQNCARRGANGAILVRNTYCSPQDAYITMNINPKYDFVSSSPAPHSISGHTVTWRINPLTVYIGSYVNSISYTLTNPGPMHTVGDTVLTTYRITPTSGDVDTTNNYFTRIDTVNASYDPNQITVYPGGLVLPCTKLKYTIDFENMGNDTAHNIAVLDTLPSNVNPKTIKLVSSSDPVNISIVNWGSRAIVKFDFPNIMLPDSSHHDVCKGNVVFTVNAKPGLPDGTVLSNRASIYFDDNEPVVTNYAGVTIGISPITGPTNVCSGKQVQFNSLSLGGTWSRANSTASVNTLGLVTGVSAGTNTISYTTSNSCGSRSVTKPLTINPTVVPAVSITPTGSTGDTICEGTTPTFGATPVNGGTSPAYQWKLNGINSGTGSSFSYPSPTNGDVLSVKLTSNAVCPAPDTATGLIILNVVAPYIPPVILNAYPGLFIGPGMADTFVATVPGGGPIPTYQWLLNGTPVPGATSDTFITNTLANNDSVTCVATGTDLCKLSTFNSFIVTVGNVGIKALGQKAEMALFPNPNKGAFTIRGKIGNLSNGEVWIEIINSLGQVVYRKNIPVSNGLINEQIQPDNIMSNGMYLLNLRSGTENTAFRFIVE
jgi:uncharacterized protein YjdB